MDRAKKVFRNPLFMIAAGAAFGILAKYGDIAYASSIFSYFGLLTSGFAIWLVIGTAIIYISNSRKRLSVLLSSFMLPMLLAYYLFSVLVVKSCELADCGCVNFMVFIWIHDNEVSCLLIISRITCIYILSNHPLSIINPLCLEKYFSHTFCISSTCPDSSNQFSTHGRQI